MPKRKIEPSHKAMSGSIETRVAQRRFEQHERYLCLLRQAQRIRKNVNSPDFIAPLIAYGNSELQVLRAQAGGVVSRRRRPHNISSNPDSKCLVYIDECGSASLLSSDKFKAFVMAAVIVPKDKYESIDKCWKTWKKDNLGSSDKFIHEPNIRRGTGPFSFRKNTEERSKVINSLNELIGKLDFSGVTCVINKPEYLVQFGTSSMDRSLPEHPYLMAMDFLMERLVMILEKQFNNARACVYAEGRGSAEDALLQYEYVRLQLDGTSFISPAWFRQQLAPAISFMTKKENCTGLQLADLLARPCGEKILDTSKTPDRWLEFREKLCPGQETVHSILGLKVIPWDDRYIDICKS